MRMTQATQIFLSLIALTTLFSVGARGGELPPAANRPVDFEKDVQPILQKNCFGCHGPKKQKGLFRLDQKAAAMKGGEKIDILPGKSAESALIHRVAGLKADEVMPPDGDTLSNAQIGVLRAWIDQGAVWPEKVAADESKLDWWSLKPLKKPAVPPVAEADQKFARTPIDAFVLATLREKKLTPSPRADRRTLIRRIYFDLTGLPPTPEEAAAFVADPAPDAYEKLVDKLLASPRYGERWARHWMDAVHFAETHGHDQDRVRPNAWPYRDYLIAAFNSDTPYAQFIQEQLAADVLFSDQPELTPALGFIAAGPWDESSLRDIREDSMCRQIGYYLDRDDMVTQTMSTFASSTVHCARCHDHKFDPISQQDYYALQADFAGLGRADRAYDADPKIHQQRRALQAQLRAVESRDAKKVDDLLRATGLDEFAKWASRHRDVIQNKAEWTTLDATIVSKESVQFSKLPDGSFLAGGLTPDADTYTLTASSQQAGISGVRLDILADENLPHKGPGRQIDNGNLHLSEISIYAAPADKPTEEKKIAIARAVADFNQASWTIEHAIDGKMETAWGIYPETGKSHYAVFEFKEPLTSANTLLKIVLEQNHGRKHVIGRLRVSSTNALHPAGKSELPAPIAKLLAKTDTDLSAAEKTELGAFFLKSRIDKELAALPKPKLVYAGARDFAADGTHRPVATPRPVFELRRGDILKPGDQAKPGAMNAVAALKGRFELADANDEGQRRAALAKWLSDPANPLTWRSIVNRVWHYHFGRGISSMPNDFGRMGSAPTHPELLDWLAAEFLESGGSLKKLHRLIVSSATYQQSSASDAARASIDSDNLFLWRMSRTRIDAEEFRDAVLQIDGRLDLTMGGPSVQHFGLSPGPHVTPVVDYNKYDWSAPGAGRRSVYRFIFRTLPDPFMDALDCADASQLTAARNVSLTPLQALALLNDAFVLKQSEILAKKLESAGDLKSQITQLYSLALLRPPTDRELAEILPYAQKFGITNVCRLVLNCSEFLFVD
jgi:mono/diheme cytochrome c family protein